MTKTIKKIETDEKNMHAGHRQRLLEGVVRGGIESLSAIQTMELILTYIYPRGDVNPLAHRLLDRFGTIAGVLEANPLDLQSVKGVGERAAHAITLLPEIFQAYVTSALSKREQLGTNNSICDYCEDMLRLRKYEELHIVALDINFRLLYDRCLAKGSLNMVGIRQSEIAKFVTSFEPKFIFMVHNHPHGSAVASKQDIEGNDVIKNVVTSLGVSFIDHLIVGCDGVYSIEKRDFARRYKQL